MSLDIPPGFGLAAFTFTSQWGTAPFVTTLGVDMADWGDNNVAAANQLMSSYGEAMDGIVNDTLSLDRVTLSIGDDGPSGSVDSDLPPYQMNRPGQAAPNSMAVIARKNTNLLGRRGRGRMFLPGVNSEADIQTDGSLDISYRNEVNAALEVFRGFLLTVGGGGPLPPVLLHSDGSGMPPTPITSFTVAPLVGWIRGRIR